MKRAFMTILILAALIFAQNINGQDKINSDNARLEAEIDKVLRDYYDAFSRRDCSVPFPRKPFPVADGDPLHIVIGAALVSIGSMAPGSVFTKFGIVCPLASLELGS